MKKTLQWYLLGILAVVALVTAYRIQAATPVHQTQDPDMARLEQIPSRSLSFVRPTDLAGILLLDSQP